MIGRVRKRDALATAAHRARVACSTTCQICRPRFRCAGSPCGAGDLGSTEQPARPQGPSRRFPRLWRGSGGGCDAPSRQEPRPPPDSATMPMAYSTPHRKATASVRRLCRRRPAPASAASLLARRSGCAGLLRALSNMVGAGAPPPQVPSSPSFCVSDGQRWRGLRRRNKLRMRSKCGIEADCVPQGRSAGVLTPSAPLAAPVHT